MTNMQPQKWAGLGLMALSLLHTTALCVGGAEAILQLFAERWFDPAGGDHARLAPFWAFEFGGLLFIVGWMMSRSAQGKPPVSRALACTLLGLVVLGAVVVPVGGFWLAIPLAAWLLLTPGARPSATRATRNAETP